MPVLVHPRTYQITTNSIYLGETYDARAATPGWAVVGYNDSAWAGSYGARRGDTVGALRAQVLPPIRRQRTLLPISSHVVRAHL